jgi:hypothetical protein
MRGEVPRSDHSQQCNVKCALIRARISAGTSWLNFTTQQTQTQTRHSSRRRHRIHPSTTRLTYATDPPRLLAQTYDNHLNMLAFAVVTALYGRAIISQATAQQFEGIPLLFNYPGTSDGCFNALNTTVTCPSFLIDITIEYVPFAIYDNTN